MFFNFIYTEYGPKFSGYDDVKVTHRSMHRVINLEPTQSVYKIETKMAENKLFTSYINVTSYFLLSQGILITSTFTFTLFNLVVTFRLSLILFYENVFKIRSMCYS